MIQYNAQEGSVMLGIIGPNLPDQLVKTGQRLIADTLSITGIMPVVGDLLTVEGRTLTIRKREFECRQGEVVATGIWFYVE